MNEPFQQKDVSFLSYPSTGWHQALFKWPIQLWRLGLGAIIGRLMILITHTGRISGLPRRTMLEYFKMDGRKYVASAFGRRAQWYKNIEAEPRVTIQTADGIERVRAVRVTDEETLLRLLAYVKRRDGPLYDVYLEALDVQPVREDILAKKDRFYWLTFEPTDEPTPPPLKADLVWIWAMLLVGLVAILINKLKDKN